MSKIKKPSLPNRDRDTFCRRYAEKYFRLALCYSFGEITEAEWNRFNRENTKEFCGIFNSFTVKAARKEAELIRKVEEMEAIADKKRKIAELTAEIEKEEENA